MYDSPIGTIWKFETARFRVEVEARSDWDCDLSWDGDGSTRESLESGDLVAFQAVATVFLDGVEVGSDSLGGCIYSDIDAFRDHIGIGEQATRERVSRDIRKVEGRFKSRAAYLRQRRDAGTMTRAQFARDMQRARDITVESRRLAMRELRSAGKVGSYFRDMVSSAIDMARATLSEQVEPPKMRATA